VTGGVPDRCTSCVIVILPAKAREYVLCVCLSVTTITKKTVDGFVPNFTGQEGS